MLFYLIILVISLVSASPDESSICNQGYFKNGTNCTGCSFGKDIFNGWDCSQTGQWDHYCIQGKIFTNNQSIEQGSHCDKCTFGNIGYNCKIIGKPTEICKDGYYINGTQCAECSNGFNGQNCKYVGDARKFCFDGFTMEELECSDCDSHGHNCKITGESLSDFCWKGKTEQNQSCRLCSEGIDIGVNCTYVGDPKTWCSFGRYPNGSLCEDCTQGNNGYNCRKKKRDQIIVLNVPQYTKAQIINAGAIFGAREGALFGKIKGRETGSKIGQKQGAVAAQFVVSSYLKNYQKLQRHKKNLVNLAILKGTEAGLVEGRKAGGLHGQKQGEKLGYKAGYNNALNATCMEDAEKLGRQAGRLVGEEAGNQAGTTYGRIQGYEYGGLAAKQAIEDYIKEKNIKI